VANIHAPFTINSTRQRHQTPAANSQQHCPCCVTWHYGTEIFISKANPTIDLSNNDSIIGIGSGISVEL